MKNPNSDAIIQVEKITGPVLLISSKMPRYFLAVAREENITRAAESLHIAQPSLSKQLMELEKKLGKKLVIRGKKKITLTEEGVILRKRAEEIVELVEKTEQEISYDLEEVIGDIYIGGSISESVLAVAAELRNTYPGIHFHFYCGDAVDVSERLNHGSPVPFVMQGLGYFLTTTENNKNI